ncbi:MAG: archaeal proteasome endopeptidase complex subunit alpha [Candidatus Altiarchaeia archaeon]|jgi:proteasome alpha subunit
MYPMGPAAYDRAITVFSPDGRLFQVEYAREAVKRGTTACGITYKGGVLLAVDKNIASKLIVPSSIEKIFQIDEHIGIAASGLVADARRLIEEARTKAQRNRLAYAEPISVSGLTRDICDIKQYYTQYGGARPFGTALLIAGVNENSYLFETDPSGAFTEYTATSIGTGKADVEKIFEKYYKEGMNRTDAIDLALRGLNVVSEEKIKKENVEMITVEIGSKYQRVDKEEIGKSLAKLDKDLEADKKTKAE